MCSLDIEGSTLAITMGPRWLWRRLARWAGEFVVDASDDVVVFGVEGWGHSWNNDGWSMWGGIGVQLSGEPFVYFGTRRKEEILPALAEAGFIVSGEIRPVPSDLCRKHSSWLPQFGNRRGD
jgi:hypothetical protein